MNKLCFGLLFLLIANDLFSNDFKNDIVYNGNIILLENPIGASQLINFTPFELRILRNMIYAKYNYRFRRSDLREYFSQFSWYKGIEDNVEKYLTNVDWKNIKMISIIENNYPKFISYNNEKMDEYYGGVRGLMILGWSTDGKLFYACTNLTRMYYRIHFGIFDIRENKVIWDETDPWGLDTINYKRDTKRIFEYVTNEYNIIFTTDYTLTTIYGYDIYSKINEQPNEPYVSEFFLEIGIKNESTAIVLRNIRPRDPYFPNSSGDYEPLSENDVGYLCIKSPFNENLIILIVIIPSYQGGDIEGSITFYEIIGIDLNELDINNGTAHNSR
ncbi:MAG: YARHG domain-containing protein [Treponema sp.]|jgi:hypothetical protein|nr:YARHG domain-containing protein [Treponema sp.]